MCNIDIVFFALRNVTKEEVQGRRVLEVGSLDVNGSLRSLFEPWNPKTYLGVDIARGPGVDLVCRAEDLVERFGRESFDLVVSTELIEHVRDWKAVVSNIKGVCASGGILLITTRSFGFRYHAYPHDYWRYELADMRRIFSDCEVSSLEADPKSPGVFMKARKPSAFAENDLEDVELYSIVLRRRVRALSDRDLRGARFLRLKLREQAKQHVLKLGRWVLPPLK